MEAEGSLGQRARCARRGGAGGGFGGGAHPGGGGPQAAGLPERGGGVGDRGEGAERQGHRGRGPGAVQAALDGAVAGDGDDADHGGHHQQVAEGGGTGLPGLLGPLRAGQPPPVRAQAGAPAVQRAEGEEFAQPVDGLHGLGGEVGEGRAGAGSSCGAATSVEDGQGEQERGGGQDEGEQPGFAGAQQGRRGGEHRSGGEELGEGVGVEELQRLDVAQRGGGEVAAAASGDAGGGAAGDPVEDADAQEGEDPVGEVVGEVHLAPGGQGAHGDQSKEQRDGGGRGGPPVDHGRSDGVGGEGDEGDEGRLVDEGGRTGTGGHGAVGGEHGQQ